MELSKNLFYDKKTLFGELIDDYQMYNEQFCWSYPVRESKLSSEPRCRKSNTSKLDLSKSLNLKDLFTSKFQSPIASKKISMDFRG